MNRRALVLGASGLVGGECLSLLLANPAYQQVTVMTRRPLPLKHDKLRQEVIEEFDEMASHAECFAVDDVFCCLGTTLKKAGSHGAFRKVDQTLVLAAAYQSRLAGAKRFLMVSAVNANPRSWSFYGKIKGETEQALVAQSLPMLGIFQPSLLRGQRQESRLGEDVANTLSDLLDPLLRRLTFSWVPVRARELARAMVALALSDPESGVLRLRYADIVRLSKQLPNDSVTPSWHSQSLK